MALSKAQKVDVLKKFEKIVSDATSMVFLHIKGITVNENNALRTQMRENAGGYSVAKKTLLRKALSNSSIAGEMPELAGGELAVAYAADMIAPAREVFAFKKKFNDNVTVIGGTFEGKYISADEVKAIAEIPAPQVLRGMFVNVINSPIQGMVIALSKIAEKKTA
jgi:large subunit ribosomal protein L10